MANIYWNDPITGEKAQFIAETIKESLFDYSYDSNRVPSLNLHFFCQDYIETYQCVKDGLMKEGNMTPLNEEFINILEKSVWLPDITSSEMLNFKNSKGYYENIEKKKELSDYLFENALFIDSYLNSKSNYYVLLLEKIKEIIEQPSFTVSEKTQLYFCTREYLAELINSGISKGHLYNQTMNKLFSSIFPKNDIEYIMSFLEELQPELLEYNIVFGISKKIYDELKNNIKGFRIANQDEKRLLSSKYVVETTFDAYDPVSALLIAKQSFSSLLSVYNSCIHETEQMIYDNGRVKLKLKQKYSFINDSLNLLKKNPNKKMDERKKWLKTAVTYQIPRKLISSFELHNTALRVSDPQTQLLSLWTINELLINDNQILMNRINCISNTLCSVLCICYYQRKLEDLYKTIMLTKEAKKIIDLETRGKSGIEKLAFILKDNISVKSQLCTIIKKHPLVVFKIETLSIVFGNSECFKNDLLRHSKRLRWQIMRIYRYRCMAVHDGDLKYHFSSLNNILENLHYYVDELFNYIFAKREEKIFDLDAILTCARVKETSIIKTLSNTNLSDQDFANILFG